MYFYLFHIIIILHIQLSIVSDSLTGKASKGSKIKKFEKQLANEGSYSYVAIIKYMFIFVCN